MLHLFQNRIYFALMILVVVIAAAVFAFYALELDIAPRSYAEIVATPTFTRGPDTPTRAPRPTTVSTPTRIPLPTQPPLAFSDPLTSTKNFSPTTSFAGARASITNNAYTIHFTQAGTAFTLLPSYKLRADNFSLQVDARAPAFSRIEYGLVFWHGADAQKKERYLSLLVSPVGSYHVGTNTAELLPYTFSNVIRTGIQPNTLRVDGRGNRLVLIINDLVVNTLEGSALDTYRNTVTLDGQVGLIAVSEFANLDVQFSNFKLFTP